MKKSMGIIILLAFILITTMIQVNIFNNVYIFGVKINLFIILTSAIALWYGMFVGGIYGLINGFILDSLYEQGYGKYLILYALIGIIVGSMNHIYKKENKVTLIYVTAMMTIVYEIIEMVMSVVVSQSFPGLFTIIKVMFVSPSLNMMVSAVTYYLFIFISYKLDEVLVIENRW